MIAIIMFWSSCKKFIIGMVILKQKLVSEEHFKEKVWHWQSLALHCKSCTLSAKFYNIVKPNFITLSSLILALMIWMFSGLGSVVSAVALWDLISDFWKHQSKAHLSIVFSTELRFIIIWSFPFVKIWRVCWAISTPL